VLHFVHEFWDLGVILGLFWMILANAAVLLGARAILKLTATGKPHLDVPFFLVLRMGLISAVVIAAGTFQALTATALGVTAAVALAALLAIGAHRDMKRPEFPDAGRILTFLTILVGIRLLIQVWLFAPYDFDAVSYHLTKIAEWIRAGGFTREMGVDTHAPFPAGFELLETWWVVFLHHDVLIEIAGIECLALACAGCYALARESGMCERWSYFAAFSYGMTPGLHLSATSCLNDVAVAALAVATAAFVLGRAPWACVLVTAALGIGVKPTYGYAIPGLLLLAYMSRTLPVPRAIPGKVALGLVTGGMIVGAFWYVRNLIWFGSPIYPVGAHGLVASTGELKIQFGPNLTSAVRNILDLVQERVYDDYSSYGPLLVRISGWGALAFACGLLSLVVLSRTDPVLRRIAIGFSLSLLSVLILVNHDDWFLRFVLFFPAILCIATARLAERHRPVLAIAGLALAYQFIATCVPNEFSLQQVIDSAGQNWRERSARTKFGADHQEASILYYISEPVHNRGESYLLYGPDYSHRVVYFRGTTSQSLIGIMDTEGVRVLYRSRITDSMDPLLQQSMNLGLLRAVSDRLYERTAPAKSAPRR
jgi:hypothetical protein